MSKKQSRAVAFEERRGSLATRFSSRGHRFEQSIFEDRHKTLFEQIPDMVRVLRIAEEASAEGNQEAAAQVNRLRGVLGNIKSLIEQQNTIRTADIFMTVARHVLPQDFFDAILAETRLFREDVAQEIVASINEALGKKGKHKTFTFKPDRARR